MKQLILIAAAICVAELAFSQAAYRDGYVVANDGDTLSGLVEYREGVGAYKSCRFKRSKGQRAVTYEPTGIAGYGFKKDKFFQSREVAIGDQPARLVFLEVLVKGPVTLYKFGGNTFFVEKDNAGLLPLTNELVEIFVNGKKASKRSNQYIGNLNMLLSDCDGMREKISLVKFDERSITNIVEDYHRCSGVAGVSYKAEKPWIKAMVGVTAGASSSQLEFSFITGYPHLTRPFETSRSVMLGISADLLSPRISERISFHTDLLYSSFAYYSYVRIVDRFPNEQNFTTITSDYIKVPFGFRYTLPLAGFAPYLNVGMSGTFHLNPRSSWVRETLIGNTVDIYKEEAVGLRNGQAGVWLGGGILKPINSRLSAYMEFRYEQTNGVSTRIRELTTALSTVTNFQVLIGIRTR